MQKDRNEVHLKKEEETGAVHPKAKEHLESSETGAIRESTTL